MANIVIKDLPDSIELDREAMRAITGGARTRGHSVAPRSTLSRGSRIVSYPTGFASSTLSNADRLTTRSKLLK
ncbi:hypothetical protein [Noviherbaspirillum massiliense]|nr:hypothetical protein [Noviherbaspirillum massiliense]